MMLLHQHKAAACLLRIVALFMLLSVLTACHDNDGPSGTAPITATGRYTIVSSDIERDYYLQLPDNYDRGSEPLPLLIALHGAGGSFEDWLEGGFHGNGLLNLAAGGAIMVMPNARPMDQGRRIWDPNSEIDRQFFLDLLDELGQRVSFDQRRIFVTGHSAGALMTHELGCRYGDIIRAIAPSAGSLDTAASPRCTGSVAVMQLQSEFDAVVPVTVVTDTRDLWVLYNGLDPAVSIDAAADAALTAPCVDYGLGASAYPVQWCLHDNTTADGHGWWSEADQAIWNFFTGLPIVEPTAEPPPGGGNNNLVKDFPATITTTLSFPPNMNPVFRVGLFLYPGDAPRPISGAPLYIVNGDVDLGDPQPGTQQTFVIPAVLPPADVLPQSYTLVIAVYVVGGTFYIPTAGVDHNVIYPLTINDSITPIVIDEVLEVVPVQSAGS